MSLRVGSPNVVAIPSTWNCSFTVIGTPASGPSVSPRARAASTASASARASSKRRAMTEFNRSSTASIWAMCASSTSRAETVPSAISRASSPALHHVSSVVFGSRPCW